MSKTILITGSTDGIGLLTAKRLTAAGHSILLHGRNEKKLAKAVDTVGSGAVGFRADVSDLEQVKELAARVQDHASTIDILINNAGVFKAPNPITEHGLDVRFVVNTIAPYILTKALLPAIPKDGRVLNLSSAAQAPIDLAALQGGARMNDMEAYAQSKLAITAWTQEMALRHQAGPVFLAINPGSLLATKMVTEGFGVAGNDLNIGADILCQAALEDSFAAATGRYFDNDVGAFAPIHRSASDPSILKALLAVLDGYTR